MEDDAKRDELYSKYLALGFSPSEAMLLAYDELETTDTDTDP